jgi:hypothetical protein
MFNCFNLAYQHAIESVCKLEREKTVGEKKEGRKDYREIGLMKLLRPTTCAS